MIKNITLLSKEKILVILLNAAVSAKNSKTFFFIERKFKM